MTRGLRNAIRNLVALAVILALLLAFAPRWLSGPAARNWLLSAVLPLNATITCGGARLGWFSPPHFDDVQIADNRGRPAVTVGTIDGDRPLWRMALNRSAPGSFRLAKVQVDVIVEPEGTNLASLVDPQKLRGAQLGLEVVDATLVFHKPGVPPWQLGPFHVSGDLNTAGPPAARELVVRPGTVLSRATITASKSSDMLQYALPVLAEADVSGQISLQVDGWRLALAEPEKSTGSGRLVIHRLDVEPGPLIQTLVDVLRAPTPIRLAEETMVPFSMAEGRIHHRDMRFSLQGVSISTSGSVSVADRSLDVIAEVQFPRDPAKNRPLLDTVQKLSIPIGGTLEKPLVDRTALRESGKQILRDALDGLLRRRS